MEFSWWTLKPIYNHEYYYIESAFEDHEVEAIKEYAKTLESNIASTGDKGVHEGELNDIRRSYTSWINGNDKSRWIYEKIDRLVRQANQHFDLDLHSIELLQFTEYDKAYTGMYDGHVDTHPAARSPDSHRKLSFSIQLSDPSEYEGGELRIYGSSLKDYLVGRKEKGTINFFPSHIIHEVTPVTEGRRYALVGWCNGPKLR